MKFSLFVAIIASAAMAGIVSHHDDFEYDGFIHLDKHDDESD